MHHETQEGVNWSKFDIFAVSGNCEVSQTVIGRSTTRNRKYLQNSNYDTLGPGFDSLPLHSALINKLSEHIDARNGKF